MAEPPRLIIAIDGPAGSGKSTAASKLAEAEGFAHLNTGAMYRAVAWLAREANLDPLADAAAIGRLAERMEFHYELDVDEPRFRVGPGGGEPCVTLGQELFTGDLTLTLGPVVNNEAVRTALVAKMRGAAHEVLERGAAGVVLEGRDIGTVVFPDAFIKFFLHASLDERARRRRSEMLARQEIVDETALREQLHYRDQVDQSRNMGPLRKAEDALDVDTSNLDVAQTLALLREKFAERCKGATN
jgi:cytidylate kinase